MTLSILLSGGASPGAAWLWFLVPFIVFILLVKGGQLFARWFLKKFLPRFFHEPPIDSNMQEGDNLTN